MTILHQYAYVKKLSHKRAKSSAWFLSQNFVTAKSGNNKVLEWNFFLLRGHW